MTQTIKPFADAVLAYAEAGWPCILPVPVEKSPPPVGFTGAEGADTQPIQLAVWSGSHADWSIALRMPDGVIGIDVDQYEKHGVAKHGFDTFQAALARFGPLPPTWTSTARGAEQPSRIHFYRAPARRYATKLSGGDVEIIQRHHRYAVVWPSPHTDAGDIYRWYDPNGLAAVHPPRPEQLPELPPGWVDGLLDGATDAGPLAADVSSGHAFLAELLTDGREACADMANAVQLAIDELTRSDAGSRHDTAIARVHHIVNLGAAGHPGLSHYAPQLAGLWEDLTAGEDRGGEWDRMLLTSARKAVTAVGPRPVPRDPCTLTGALEVGVPIGQVDPVRGGPGPVDDRKGHDAPEPIEAPRELHPQEVVGNAPFTPREHLDQLLADAVLARMYPVLRFGYDARTWLKRQRVTWEQGPELAEWAVTQVAEMMPRGNPDAEKGSDDRDQAERRKRLMSASGAGAVAKMMRARVAGGSHPCALRIADLDSEPWLLWAGGVGWDLTASREIPTQALIDPATPHLHSAGVAPEPRPTPAWDAFTAAVWPDPELRAFALRVLSIAFTGYSDRALPILLGEQGRGKTQVVALLMSVLGSYAHAADPRLLTSTDNAHASIVYALKGRRLSFIDEGPREGRLGMERLKQLTGGGDLTGNQMRANPITFAPTHTLVLTSNDEPVLTDPAVRNRVRLLPCEGDPAAVRAARAAIGHTSGRVWRRESPGVLAAMMREAALWLAEPDSALTSAAPEAYRMRAEEIAGEQEPVRNWTVEETDPHEEGERSRVLYEAFVGWCKNGNLAPGRIPSETKWGKELTSLGYPPVKARTGNFRGLRLRPRGGWIGGGLTPIRGGLVEGSSTNPPHSETPMIAGLGAPQKDLVEGVEGLHPLYAHTQAHMRAHTHAQGNPGQTLHPPHPPHSEPVPSASIAAAITAKLQAAAPHRPAEVEASAAEPEPVDATEQTADTPPAKTKRAKVDPAVKAAAKAAERQALLEARIAEAAGPLVDLPAVVTRDGTVTHLELGAVPGVAETFGWDAELTVDVETTGYPIGHADFALRTVQLGCENIAVVLDAGDQAHLDLAAGLLRAAAVLHAHSATADLVPLAEAGAVQIDDAWSRMHDTVIPAKLADPQSTGSDPGLKQLAHTVLGATALSPAADAARAELFKAGKWLTDTKPTTPLERSGWAQVNPRCTTMIRYAASDVLDDAALARRLPPVTPPVLERERTAQRMTATVAHLGVRIDGELVDAKLVEHRDALAAAGRRLQELGVDNPGSDQQVGARLASLGAALERTKTGRPSVAKGVLDPFAKDDGPIGELVRARLDYQHHETVLGLFLEPYAQLVHRGDGRARPTVYTLAADTGRMSCVRPNFQQVPRQGGIRSCITADPGEVIVSADFASVEIRVAAALTGDTNLARMLAAGRDLHMETAKQAYGPEATKEDRYNTKRGVFGRLYGSGIAGIARTLGVSEAEAAAIVASLDAMTPEMTRWITGLKQAVQGGMTTFETYAGRVVHLDPKLPHKAFNYCVQGTARELLVDALMRWQHTRWGRCRLVPVHDEVLVFVPEDDAQEATDALVACMQSSLYGVDIKAEASAPSFEWKDAS